MASFLNANLPSEDEEDEDFVPTERDEDARPAKKKARRVRGAAIGAAPTEEEDEPAGPGPGSAGRDEEDLPAHKREAKKARVDALWQQLNAQQPSKRAAPLSLAQLCQPVTAAQKKAGADDSWKRHLGLASSSKPKPPPPPPPAAAAAKRESADAVATAAAALAAARQAASSTAALAASTVTVHETRRFAGQEVTVAREVAKGSKDAARAEAAAEAAAKKQAGLDAVLASLASAKKVTVLDKSRADWGQLKKSDDALHEELEAHKRSADQYLERQAFLKNVELKQYEAERDARLASDVRNRGRL